MQQRRSHPLHSRFGCGSALVLVTALLLILYFRGGGPFNPGPLTAMETTGNTLGGFDSHAEFEAECGQCHAPWRGPAAERCESCHTTVAQERVSAAGLHGQLPDVGRCQSCHTDHVGRTVNITSIDADRFDHARLTGFSLAQHAVDFTGLPMSCAACHIDSRYAGGQISCLACHQEAEPAFMAEHVQLFGDTCLDCHDGSGRLVDFDHDQVFPLMGAHVQATCESCHVERLFAGTPRECVACHEEPAVHAGLFGTDCVRCHTEVAWAPAQLTAHTFPLDHGRPVAQACEVCHTDTYTTYTCYNCHEHDPADVREAHVDECIFEFQDCVSCHPTGQEDEAEDD